MSVVEESDEQHADPGAGADPGADRGAGADHGTVGGAGAGDAAFEAERPRLTGLAYRMLGTLSDAEDVVQEAWLRWQRVDRDDIRNVAAWLTTVTSRLALDRLRTQRRRREDYVGPWLPEPVLTDAPTPPGDDPAEAVELAESMTLGFLLVLDRLGPVERAVFLLADVFGEPYADIATVVDRSPEACRQIASRARRKVRADRAPASPVDESLLAELMGAVMVGDVPRLIALLSPEVVLTSDGGPNRRAARRPVLGPARVARLLINLTQRMPSDADVAFERINGGAALVVRSEELSCVLTADRGEDGTVAQIRMILNPDKLSRLDRPVVLS